LLACVLGSSTCLREPGFVCEDSAQCVAAEDGVCTDVGWCAYPDDACASGQRFGEFAPDDVAGVCVGEQDDEPPQSLCGNGVVDELETCDDHNRDAGDSCHPQCVEPGTVLWTVRWDGEAHSEDKAFGIAIDPANQSFYISGFTTTLATEKQDVLVQRRWIETGGLVWSRSHGGDARGDDSGENVAIDASGNAIVAGVEITTIGGADVWLGAYDVDGAELWTTTHDEQGGIERGDGVAITANGDIVVVGSAAIDRGGGMVDADVWTARYDRDGNALGVPTLHGSPGVADHGIDALADGDEWLATGRMTDTADGEYRVWTARFGADDVQIWQDLASADVIGNEARGVGMGCDPQHTCATAGVLSNDIWVRFYDPAGVPTSTITEQGEDEMHDEAADVAFVGDGSIVVVGFMDYATEGFATGDCWIARIAADGTHMWTDLYDGPSREVDKALAVELTDDRSAIVAGYETVPGQGRDVWIRRYAI
jgi:cysteine-rich repeat protein